MTIGRRSGKTWGDFYERLALASGTEVEFNLPPIDRHRKPRVGLLFADLKPTADTYFGLPLFEYLDPSLEVAVYVLAKEIDRFEYYCLERCPRIAHLPNDLIHRIDFLRNEDLDVLIFPPNTTHHSQLSLLGTHRLARYQLFGDHRQTSGLKHIDGMFVEADGQFEVEAEATSWTEKRWAIPTTATCFSMGSLAQPTLTPIELSALQIRESDIVFGSTVSMRVCHREQIELWLSILARVPNSILLLLPFEQDQAADRKQAFFHYVQSICREQGVDIGRVRLATPDPYPSFDELPRFLCRAHVVLDSNPISSPVQAIGAFRLGLPIVTQRGKYPQTRVAAELIEKLSPEISVLTVADSRSDYVNKAVALAGSPELRQRIREETLQKLPTASFIDSHAFGRRLSELLNRIVKAM